MDFNFVYRDMLPEKGAVNIVQDGPTTYRETRETVHTGPSGENLRKSGKRGGYSMEPGAIKMREWRAKNRAKVEAANKKRAEQRKEERKKKKEIKEKEKKEKQRMEKIPNSFLLSKYATAVNAEAGATGTDYIIRSEITVHTRIEHFHERTAPENKENAKPLCQIYTDANGVLRRAVPQRVRGGKEDAAPEIYKRDK